MFKFKQDSAILHGAFMSAQRRIQLRTGVPDRNLCILSDDELNTVAKLVTGAVDLARRDIWTPEWEKPDASLAMRAHATVFYTVLRSAGITCGPADEYYLSLSAMFPVIDWAVYMTLLQSCKWYVFFLECINDMPDDASAYILDNMLTQIQNNRKICDYRALNTVLQAVMQKLLGFKLAPKHRNVKDDPPKFCFPFDYVPSSSLICISQADHSESQETLSEVETASETPKPLTFSELLSTALAFSTEEDHNAEVLKVFLHGLLTLFDICTQMKHNNLLQKFDFVEPLICGALKCVQSQKCAELIALASSKFSAASIKKEFVLNYISWDVDIVYLSFLVYGGWNELTYYLESCNRIGQGSVISKVDEIVQILCKLLPLQTENLSERRQFLDALIFIADNKLIGINYALAVFIGHSDYLEETEVIACLERNMPLPAERTLIYSLLKVIMKQSLYQKDKLSTIFFRAAKGLSVFEQQCMLQNFVLTYGLSENLKQQNFAKEVFPILNQTVNADQAEKEIILLCLQSPKECISIIVQQAVKGNSGQIAVLVKMLKLLSSVCAFRNSEEASLLVNELRPYFSSATLTPQQLKNLRLMTEELLQVLNDNDGLKPSELLVQCVLPYVEPGFSAALSFTLEVLEIILSSSLAAKRTDWLGDVYIPAVIGLLGGIINFSIIHKSGSLKEKVVSILDVLYELQLREEVRSPCLTACEQIDFWIQSYLYGENAIVPCYIEKCVAKYTSVTPLKPDIPDSFDTMWLSSCISRERLQSPMKEFILKKCDITYIDLVVFLSRVLPHLTLQEWLHSAVLLEDCIEFLSMNSHLQQPVLKDRNLKHPISMEILVDALTLLSRCDSNSLDWTYMVSSFAKVVSDHMCHKVEELHLETLVMLFLELCRLASELQEKVLELITVPLLDIFKILKTIPCFANGTTGFSTCVYAAVRALPDCVTRSNVLGSMKAF